ncbi:MAG TPA: hypothetical protein VLJ41_03035 [Segetibacter sp.]|nr:hypothetical protein [Segetibacter sp.]
MIVFVGYYSPENYELLLKTANDRKKLDDKWEDWLMNFIKVKTSLSGEFSVEEFHVDVEKMNQYFRANKIKNTSANRAKYIQEVGASELQKRTNN